MTATHRWRTWALVRSVRGGKNEPFMSGQSLKMSAELTPPAVTLLPNRSSPYVAAVPNVANSVNRWLLPRPAMRAGKKLRVSA